MNTEHEIIDNPLTSGKISHQILSLAWPTMLTMVLETMFNLVDAFWVGKLGAEALAAVSASSFIIWAMFSVSHISSTGLTAIVSQHRGACEPERAVHASVQGSYLAVFLGVIVGLGCYVLMPQLFALMNLTAGVLVLAEHYLVIQCCGVAIAFLYIAMESIFRSSVDTRTPMVTLLIGLLLNAILDPLLIFGYCGFPAMGIRGAALATIVSFSFALVLIIIQALSRGYIPRLRDAIWRHLDLPIMVTIVKIGSPVAISGISFSFVYIFLTRIINYFGTAPLAAVGVGHRLEGIAYLTSVGFAIAASTLVGQNLGAGKSERAARAAWQSTLYASLIMGVFSLLVIFFGPRIISIFIADQEVIILGWQYLMIIACCEVFLAFEVVLEGAFSGAGDTLPPMLISIPLTILRVPAAYFFAITLGYGIVAIWCVISLSTAAKGILMAIWFRKGRWRTSALVTPVPVPVAASPLCEE